MNTLKKQLLAGMLLTLATYISYKTGENNGYETGYQEGFEDGGYSRCQKHYRYIITNVLGDDALRKCVDFAVENVEELINMK